MILLKTITGKNEFAGNKKGCPILPGQPS